MGVLRGTARGEELSGTVFLLCQELLAQHEAVDGDGVVDGRAGVRDGRGEGRGVRLPDGPGLLRQEVRLHVRRRQERDVRANGLVAQRQEVKPAVQMRNSVDTYYRNVLPTAKTSSYTFNRFRSQPLLRAKPMVELAPKRMGSTYFNTFMAVP